MFNYKRSYFLSGILTLLFALFMGISDISAQDGNVVDVVKQSSEHTIFAQLIETAQVEDILKQEGPYTVIAPTDEAFEALGETFEQIKNDPQQIQTVVINHLFQGQVSAEEVGPATGAEIIDGDIPASNGVVHSSKTVLAGN
ncbi:MAG: fasciclin domain-containing protein [Balneolaceae bacterium]